MSRDWAATLLELRAERNEPMCAFVYDLGELAAHARRTVSSLPKFAHLYYAIKANSEEAILRTLAPIVHGFEVASLGEIVKVRSVAPDAPIIFGGPAKTDVELGGALGYNVQWFHVESLHEGLRLEAIAARLGHRVPILLRVNVHGPLPSATITMSGTPTQFGIDEQQLPEVARRLLECPHLEIVGFHLHCLSNQLDAQTHLQLIANYCRRVRQWAADFGIRVTHINAGGGIGVNYGNLDNQFDWPTFAAGLTSAWDGDGAELVMECGRYFTAFCGKYVCEVLDVKRNHGQAFALLRGGTQHFRLPSSWQHSHPFTIIPREDWPYDFERGFLSEEAVTMTGQLCTPKDVLARGVFVQCLRPGDLVCFEHAGAYGWSISHHDFLSHPHAEFIYLD